MAAFNPERAALVLVDALALGDKQAAEKWNVTDRTLRNYRERLASDPDFAALFLAKKTKAEGAWRVVRLRFLRQSIAKLQALVEKADSPDHIKAVADAVKVVGELQIASDALSVDADHQPGELAAEDAAGAPAGGAARTLQ